MGNQNVKPAKRQAQVYPFNETEKKSRTEWTAGKSISLTLHVAIPGTHTVCLICLFNTSFLTKIQVFAFQCNTIQPTNFVKPYLIKYLN